MRKHTLERKNGNKKGKKRGRKENEAVNVNRKR